MFRSTIHEVIGCRKREPGVEEIELSFYCTDTFSGHSKTRNDEIILSVERVGSETLTTTAIDGIKSSLIILFRYACAKIQVYQVAYANPGKHCLTFIAFPIALSTEIVIPIRGNLLLLHNEPERRLEVVQRYPRPQPLQVLAKLGLHLRQVVLVDGTTLST